MLLLTPWGVEEVDNVETNLQIDGAADMQT